MTELSWLLGSHEDSDICILLRDKDLGGAGAYETNYTAGPSLTLSWQSVIKMHIRADPPRSTISEAIQFSSMLPLAPGTLLRFPEIILPFLTLFPILGGDSAAKGIFQCQETELPFVIPSSTLEVPSVFL